MILIISDKKDLHADQVEAKLIDQGLPYYRFNLDVYSLLQTSYLFHLGDFQIIQDERLLEIKNVSCVWSRRTCATLLESEAWIEPADFGLWRNEWDKTLDAIFYRLRKLPWLNPLEAANAAQNKYLQMQSATESGFSIPETLISNNRAALLRFQQLAGPVTLRFLDHGFYGLAENAAKMAYVNKLTESNLAKFTGINENPIVLQRYIERAYQVRYTIVDRAHFACRIDSRLSRVANIDWGKYDLPNAPQRIIHVRESLRAKMNHLMNTMGLIYGSVNFIVDKNNKWFFLGINPMGDFLELDIRMEEKISRATAEWLYYNLNAKHKYSQSMN